MEEKKNPNFLAPDLHHSVFVAEGARICGDVTVGEGSSIWYNAVLRGDEGPIVIGKYTNIQDTAVLHSDLGVGVRIADRVTVGHGAVIRGCRIGAGSMIGMQATVMTHARIGENCIVGANALVPYRKEYPPRSLIIGIPARVVRPLTEEEIEFTRKAVETYMDLARRHAAGEIRTPSGRHP